MKILRKVFCFAIAGILSLPAYAEMDEKIGDSIVRWKGVVRGNSISHTTNHQHQLEFIREIDGKIFDVVDSPRLLALHHASDRNYRVRITGELTSRFFFWGGNLIVKDFAVLEELDKEPLQEPRRNINRTHDIR